MAASLQGTKVKPRKGSGGRKRGSGAVRAIRRQTHSAGSPGSTGTQVKGSVGGR